ncbi:hypothetical protein D0S45_17630 [Marinifilum sp. JC120]|nr:hypothetical protein D0S45_17630 [Marinifilum sp. JC120]
MKEKYPALRMRYNDTGKWLVFFSAPATHIGFWGGVPEKAEISDTENAGFQRGLNKQRVNKIKSFLSDQANIVQNPLLCAKRESDYGDVIFTSEGGEEDVEFGYIEISSKNLENENLIDLLKAMKEQLESRMETLKDRDINSNLVNELRESESCLAELGDSSEMEETEDVDTEEQENDNQYFDDESFITEFWDTISARIKILESMGGGFELDCIGGFTKKSIAAFLKPIVIVDGQHRLEGALALARDMAAEEESIAKIDKLMEEEFEADEAQFQVETDLSRKLPISLLMDTNPAEHVFQFVVVNQKATPITRPLLGTIVSTSLSNDELKGVTNRLLQAEIPIYESQAVSSLARDPQSPFYGFVDRGFGKSTNRRKRLHWSVLSNLVKVFRSLKGGRLYHSPTDETDRWRRQRLPESAIVSDYENCGYNSHIEYWSDSDGPWRDCFIAFFSCVKKYFGSDNPDAQNYWGSTESNLFNKVSLHILLCDFFQFMCDATISISSSEEIENIFDRWLMEGKVSCDYFAKNWVYNVKKDATATKKQWAHLWEVYRKDPKKLPPKTSYGKPYRS